MRTPAQPVALTSPGPDSATQRDPVQRRRLPSGNTPRCSACWKVPPRRPSRVIKKALATRLDRRPSSRLRVVPCGSAIAITAIARDEVSFRRTARSLDRPTPPEATLTKGVPAGRTVNPCGAVPTSSSSNVLALVRSCTSPRAVTPPTSVARTRTYRAAVPAGKERGVSERYWPELYQAATVRQVRPSVDRSIA